MIDSVSYIFYRECYSDIKDFAKKMIAFRNMENDLDLIRKLDEIEIPDNCGISFYTQDVRTYISETENFFIVQTNSIYEFDYELEGLAMFIPEEVSEDIQEHGYIMQEHVHQDSMCDGIEKCYKYWFLEYDVAGIPSSPNACCDNNHITTLIRLDDGTKICPQCRKENISEK